MASFPLPAFLPHMLGRACLELGVQQVDAEWFVMVVFCSTTIICMFLRWCLKNLGHPAGFEHTRYLPASATRVLGLKACSIVPCTATLC